MTCSHMSYFFISKQLLWELFFRISNSNAKYEEKFTLEPSIGINFPIKIKHDYLLVFKYIDKGNIKNIRICVLCSKQKEGTEGTASWIAEGIDSVDISMTTGLCTIISKSTWLSLSVHEL